MFRCKESSASSSLFIVRLSDKEKLDINCQDGRKEKSDNV